MASWMKKNKLTVLAVWFSIITCSTSVSSKGISLMGRGCWFMKIRIIMRGTGLTVKPLEKGHFITTEEYTILDNGKTIRCMGEGKKNGQTEPLLQEYFRKDIRFRVNFNGPTVTNIRVSLLIIKSKALANTPGVMVGSIPVTGRTI